MEGLGVAASVIAVVELSAKVASRLLEYSRKVKNAKDDIERLRRGVNGLTGMLQALDVLVRTPGKTLPATQQLDGALEDCLLLLKNLDEKLNPEKVRKRHLWRWIWPFESEEVERVVNDLEPIKTTISLALQVDQTDLIVGVHRKLDFSKLPTAEGAEFDSHIDEHDPRCLPDTRVDLLKEITLWAEGTSENCIFWLNGMAGTGKSTVSRSVAQYFSQSSQLGASFFFKRGGGDRSHAARFFTTIAAQLGYRLPGLRPFIGEAIDSNPDISQKALGQQFEKLILKPLSMLQCQGLRLVIVVDALDECERQEDVSTILYLLSQLRDVIPISLRVFITSRPELPIRLGFKNMEGDTYKHIILQEISPTIIEHDISVFLQHEFKKIRDSRSLPLAWPGEESIQALVKLAVPLFIFASTVCRFVRDPNWNPKKRLAIILESQRAAKGSSLDKLYTPILEQLLIGQYEEQKELIAEFHQIVGAIVVLANPLSICSLAGLLDIPEDDIDCRLNLLHSVINITADKAFPVKWLHLSFREYLLDPRNRQGNAFWIDEEKTHEILAVKCLDLLDKSLKKDLCNIRKTGTLRSEMDDSTVNTCLPAEVQYACRYWFHHLERSSGLFPEELVYDFLQKHFLHWLEAMSLMRNVPESITMIITLESNLETARNSDLRAFVYDAKRFALYNREAIEEVPLELYSSALLFVPKNSLIRKQFEMHIPDWIKKRPPVQEHWDSCLLTRTIPVNLVVSIVTFSPDGKQIIYGVNNTVELWDSSTGTILHTLEGHFGFVHSVACSRDGKQVASGAFDLTVRIWDPSSGAVLHMLYCDMAVNSLAFSIDGKQVASAGESTRGDTDTSLVQIWDTATGAETRTLEVPSGGQISFSPNDKWFLSIHTDHVCLWDLATGTLIQKFGHNAHVYSAAFSPDSKYVAVVGKGDLRFYDTTLGLQQRYDYSLVAPVPEDELSDIRLISFSPDGNRLFGTSFSGTLWIWDATTGAELQTLMRYSGVVAAAFSPDGKQVVSISQEGKIQLWDASMKLPAVTHSGLAPSVSPDTTAGETQVSSVAILLDGKIVLSGAGDRMRLWDIGTGILLQEVIASGRIETIVVSSDGRQVASAARGTIQFWYVTVDERLQYRCHIRDDGHPFIKGSTLSSDGERFLCARFRDATGDSPPEVARLWNVHTGTVLRKIYPTDPDSDSRDASTLISLSSDGKHILQGYRFSPVDIKISDAATGLPLQAIQCDCESIVALNFSPDNKRIVVGTRRRTQAPRTWNDFDTLELYDVKGGALLQTFEVPVSIQSLTFSPDGSAELGLYLLKDWLMDGQQRLLFLPPEYRSSRISVNGRLIALATSSQKLSILQFDEPSKIT